MKMKIFQYAAIILLLQFPCNIFAEDNDGDGIDDYLEEQIAYKFAPVLHRHSWDLQEGLQNFDSLIANYVNIEVMSLSGTIPEYFLQTDPLCKIHKWNNNDGCSFGKGYGHYRQYKFNMDNDAWYESAAIGSRPVYFIIYKQNCHFYIDYWFYYGINDLRFYGQSKQGAYHESDWEHVTLQLHKNSNINHVFPWKVNFYRHEGGRTFAAEQCWWSTSRMDTTYESSKLQKGYDENHTHLHIWLAANSHASYNRFSEVFNIRIDSRFGVNPQINQEMMKDNVDYHPQSNDLYFAYDTLMNLGNDIRIHYGKKFHSFTYQFHYDTVGIATKYWLCYQGRLGSDFLVETKYYGPYRVIAQYFSPLMPTFQMDIWKKFPENYSIHGFGNEGEKWPYIIVDATKTIGFESDGNIAGD